MLSALSEKLAGLNRRERLTLLLGAAAVLLILLYTQLWRPWQDELNRLHAQVPEKARTLEWMRARADEVDALAQRARSAEQSGLPLLTLIERSANQVEIRETISRMSPGEEEDQVRVWMDNAEFDRWLSWLQALNDSGIRVAEANVDRAADNRVNIRATLQR